MKSTKSRRTQPAITMKKHSNKGSKKLARRSGSVRSRATGRRKRYMLA